jgi:hypothetical protein
MNRSIFFLLLFFLAPVSMLRALPQRLIITLDGISYRDLKALQEGTTDTNRWGMVFHRRAFTSEEGYFPVSRMISTFPSTSDVAWTDIFGNRPNPGYQRTYFSVAANSIVWVNGLTSTIEHERQMDWQADSNFTRSMGYVYSVHTFEFELHKLVAEFWNAGSTNRDFYIYIRSSDDAQHMERDILSMLAMLDEDLQNLRARYQAKEGHDLQILVLSDHGHNHAGRGERVPIGSFLEKSGYHITQSILGPKDVVLPTSGIEDWIEIHNLPSETAKLAEQLIHLPGTDVIAARLPDPTNTFLVLNPKGERALIHWNPTRNTFQYSAEKGDPLGYLPVVEKLAQKKLLDKDGFATADDWMNETMTNHYPLALERIARGLTCVILNPATILVSLDNRYVNAGWLVNSASALEGCGSTHGALDDINSTGIILSNFTPTHDTSTDRLAGCFDGFPGLRVYRDEENGAEWVSKCEEARIRIPRDPLDSNYTSLPDDGVFLRVWSPELAHAGDSASFEAAIEKVSGQANPPAGGQSLKPTIKHVIRVTFNKTLSLLAVCPYERIYACPPNLRLEPQADYEISGWVEGAGKNAGHFEFDFRTDNNGRPVAY